MQVGHVEDVVVDDGYRGQKMGQRCALDASVFLQPVCVMYTVSTSVLYMQGHCCIGCIQSKPRLLQSHSRLLRQQCALL